MNRRELLKAVSVMYVGGRVAGKLFRVDTVEPAEEVKPELGNGAPIVMTPKQWLSFHKKHWPPRYD